MPTYRMVYGDDVQVVRETYADVEVEREDGWVVLFRGTDAILRVREEHVQSLETVDEIVNLTDARPDSRLQVRDLMRPAVTTVERNAHLAAAAYLMKHAHDSALVVINEGDVPTAIITDSDVAQAVADGRDLDQVRISDLVAREPVTVGPTTPVVEAAALMVASGIRHLPVVDDDRLLGMIDISDACRGLLNPAAVTR